MFKDFSRVELEFDTSSDNWKLWNQGSLELTKDTNLGYQALWSEVASLDTLIIGGGDLQLYSMLYNKRYPDKITVIDPLVNMYPKEYYDVILEGKDLSQLVPINKLFNDWYRDPSRDAYKFYPQILVDVSAPDTEEARSIYKQDFFEKLKSLNCNRFHMYVPPQVEDDVLHWLYTYFTDITYKTKYFNDWEENATVYSFRKESLPSLSKYVYETSPTGDRERARVSKLIL